jgi:hypothetical protein
MIKDVEYKNGKLVFNLFYLKKKDKIREKKVD